jgi:uncharacterized secreted protein with C-terminal beta-propeller domain
MSDFESRARKAAESVREQIDENTPNTDRGIKRAKRSPLRTTVPSTVVVLVLVAAGLFALNKNDSSPPKGPNTQYQLASSLQPFNACSDTLQYFKDQSVQYYENLLQNGGGGVEEPDDNGTGTENPSGPNTTLGGPSNGNSLPGGSTTQGSSSPTTTTPQFSTTNVQEPGVDEPDTIKTDGNIIVTINGGTVYVLTANNGHPQIQSKLSYSGTADSVLLSGTRLVLFDGNDGNGNQEIIATYDISNPAMPVLVGQLQVDGALVDARMVGTQIRVATSWQTDPQVPSPDYDENGDLTQKSKAALPGEIAATTLKDWLPQFTETNGEGQTVSVGQLMDCDKLSHPTAFAGLDSTSLFTFDVNSMPAPNNAVGVLADGDTMYATASDTYISSTAYDPNAGNDDDNGPDSTAIHEFVTDSNGDSKYTGSGSVDGSLLDAYSMSEYNGVLRVATTTSDERGLVNPHEVSQGIVTTLHNTGNQLVEVGKVVGLGANDNESITAVRFVGGRGYVSTARETDPFYVVDLSDPSNPKLAGQLQVPGSTSYLEPLSNDLILAVGQSGTTSSVGAPPLPIRPEQNAPGAISGSAATPNSANVLEKPLPQPQPFESASKLQFSLYDVSNPSSPKQVGVLTYGAGQAGAESDPHAFLYWQPRNLVIAPADVSDVDGLNEFSGLLMMQADGDTLKEVGRLADTEADTQTGDVNVTRSIVIGNDVYMLSDDNLQVDSLDTQAQLSTVALPG